jgi:hypothetical protein
MSGYLQRMAAAAVKPERRVHPFVRPLYEAASDPVSEVVTERVSPRVSESANHSGPAPIALRARETGTPAGERASEITPARIANRYRKDRFESLLPEVVQEASTELANLPLRSDVKREESSDAQRHDRSRDDGVTGEEQRRFEPLVKQTRREADEEADNVSPHRDGEPVTNGAPSSVVRENGAKGEAFAGSGLRNTAELAAGRRLAQQHAIARAEQGGDDIQIHIGRIEVTAMPPAAPRPVPAPVRKSQTLDEYLRQRNGRAG